MVTSEPSTPADVPSEGARWRARVFDRGAAALERAFGPTLDRKFGTGRPRAYMCPLCARFYGREAAIAGDELTIEHVPADSLGGIPLVLTCDDCNHKHGAALDVHAHRRERLRRLAAGAQDEKWHIRLSIEGREVAASYYVDPNDDRIALKVAKEPTANRRGTSAFVRQTLFGDGSDLLRAFKISTVEAYNPKRANMSLLRAAYLAWFAVDGYPAICGPARAVVRDQILAPGENLIPHFCHVEGDAPISERYLLIVREPAEIASCGVRIGPYTILLPPLEDIDFYNRVSKYKGAFRAEYGRWPTEARFGGETSPAASMSRTLGT